MGWISNIKKNNRDKIIAEIKAQVESGQVSPENGAAAILQVNASTDAIVTNPKKEEIAVLPTGASSENKNTAPTAKATNPNMAKYIIFGCAGLLAIGIIYKLTKK